MLPPGVSVISHHKLFQEALKKKKNEMTAYFRTRHIFGEYMCFAPTEYTFAESCTHPKKYTFRDYLTTLIMHTDTVMSVCVCASVLSAKRGELSVDSVCVCACARVRVECNLITTDISDMSDFPCLHKN